MSMVWQDDLRAGDPPFWLLAGSMAVAGHVLLVVLSVRMAEPFQPPPVIETEIVIETIPLFAGGPEAVRQEALAATGASARSADGGASARAADDTMAAALAADVGADRDTRAEAATVASLAAPDRAPVAEPPITRGADQSAERAVLTPTENRGENAAISPTESATENAAENAAESATHNSVERAAATAPTRSAPASMDSQRPTRSVTPEVMRPDAPRTGTAVRAGAAPIVAARPDAAEPMPPGASVPALTEPGPAVIERATATSPDRAGSRPTQLAPEPVRPGGVMPAQSEASAAALAMAPERRAAAATPDVMEAEPGASVAPTPAQTTPEPVAPPTPAPVASPVPAPDAVPPLAAAPRAAPDVPVRADPGPPRVAAAPVAPERNALSASTGSTGSGDVERSRSTTPSPATPRPSAEAPARVVPDTARADRIRPEPQEMAALAPLDEDAPRATGQAPGDLAAPSEVGAANPDARDLYAQVLDHLRALEPQPCFTALPAVADDNTLRFEVFGPTDALLQDFRAGIEARTGLIPGMVMRPITDGQCETLDFVRRAPDYPAYNLYFTLDNREIASGSRLAGQVHNSFGRQVHLLLIDNSGRVQRLDTFLQFARGTAAFDIPMTLQGSPVETWQLLLALAVPAWLDVVRAVNSPTDARAFFAELNREMDEKGIAPDLSLIAFSVR